MRRRTLSVLLVVVAAVPCVGPGIRADAAQPSYCAAAKALAAANLARGKLDPGVASYPKSNVASLRDIVTALKGLETKLSGEQKTAVAADRKQTEKLVTAVAKGSTAMAQTQAEASVRTDFTPESAKALKAYESVYPAIDTACGTTIMGRRVKVSG
jgi:hypothetical protein